MIHLESAPGGVADVGGGRPSLGHRAAAIVAGDRSLNRVARLAAWLEDLAASRLDQEQAEADRSGAAAIPSHGDCGCGCRFGDRGCGCSCDLGCGCGFLH